MPVPATLWRPGMRITDARMNAKDYQAGIILVSFTNQTSHTEFVPFPEPFPVTPMMSVEIASGSGVTGRFEARPISVNASGFTLFVLVTDSSEGPDTWASQPVHWIAHMPT
ncbi:H-type lectin domain-containing protein [Streptomyces sp. YPW6]|uniref:H-type lectin domain-containing protein n=1 Tax=Streptomyces sp. YPW6 TaxID=2840373 RepID=UPI001C0D91C1|nr:H-type lectin domain-containing protein [Streptomyces sp. YPW6]QWQ43050.1 H-type lectin domain-containing protein [Streptomyces sp. YPW6]